MRRSTAFHFPSAVRHKKQQDHLFVLIPRMLARVSIKPFSRNRADLGLLFRCRRIDFSDPAQAVGFGRMRAGDEGSADFGRVPAGFHTEAKRFFCHDVTRREILHHGAFGWGRSIVAGTGRMKCSLERNTGLFRSLPRKVG